MIGCIINNVINSILIDMPRQRQIIFVNNDA